MGLKHNDELQKIAAFDLILQAFESAAAAHVAARTAYSFALTLKNQTVAGLEAAVIESGQARDRLHTMTLAAWQIALDAGSREAMTNAQERLFVERITNAATLT